MTCRHGGKARGIATRSAHVPRLVPAGKRTTDRGRYLTRPRHCAVHSCGHSAGFSPASPFAGGINRRTLVLRRRAEPGRRSLVKRSARSRLGGARHLLQAGRNQPLPKEIAMKSGTHPDYHFITVQMTDGTELPDPLDLGQGRRHAAPRNRSDARIRRGPAAPAACSTPAARSRASTSASAASRSARSNARRSAGGTPSTLLILAMNLSPASTSRSAPTLETERLVLRHYRKSDFHAQLAIRRRRRGHAPARHRAR